MSISEDQVSFVKSLLLDRLQEKSFLSAIVGLQTQRRTLYNTLRYTIENGTSNSLLLIGARATGKSMITKDVLKLLNRQCSSSTQGSDEKTKEDREKPFHVVRLNGFIHTDDRIALQEFAKQLYCLDDIADVRFHTFSDCLEYILRRLCYVPSNAAAQQTLASEQTQPHKSDPVSLIDDDNYCYDENVIQQNNDRSTPIVFILEEFELFAARSKQTLLYNLFDLVQSTKDPPIAVVGMTCRLDVTDFLEKRVRSRFSQRKILFTRTQSFAEFCQIFRLALRLPNPDDSDNTVGMTAQKSICPLSEFYVSKFNKSVESLLLQSQDILQRLFNTSKDIRQLFSLLLPSVLALSSSQPYLTSPLTFVELQQFQDSKIQLLQGISLLELSLLIAMKRLQERDLLHFTFEMVYDEYRQFAAKTGTDPFPKAVAMKGFEHLILLECVLPVDTNGVFLWTGCAGTSSASANIGTSSVSASAAANSSSMSSRTSSSSANNQSAGGAVSLLGSSLHGTSKEFRMMRLAVEKDQIHELIKKHPHCPTQLRQWGLKWLE